MTEFCPSDQALARLVVFVIERRKKRLAREYGELTTGTEEAEVAPSAPYPTRMGVECY
jgi:hypothetical protein